MRVSMVMEERVLVKGAIERLVALKGERTKNDRSIILAEAVIE